MVRLVPMKATEYQSYLAISIREYAEEKVQAGNWQPEEALEKSAQDFQKLLPDGRFCFFHQVTFCISSLSALRVWPGMLSTALLA